MVLQQSVRQSQKQTLTPAMWMGLNLLALPIGELKDAVQKEVDGNPALEIPSSYRPIRTTGEATDSYLENIADSRNETLEEHLMSELRMNGTDARTLSCCQAVIGSLDDDGRFTGSVPDLVMATGASADEIERARQLVMSIEPKGCGARDLAECYRAQLDDVPKALRESVGRIVEAIAAQMRGAKGDLRFPPEALRALKKLEAFPGRLYDRRKVEVVVPDVTVDASGEITVDTGDIPELQVSPRYVAMAKDASLDDETRQYAAERVKRAREFREAVIRRRETMETVADVAIGGQTAFLRQGVSALRRQTMTEVARRAKCSVSTVSRAAARKYVKTPRGVVPLRTFFKTVDQAPLEHLKNLLVSFKAGARPSDSQIAARMKQEGYPMARRTVAKYRSRFALGSEI